MIPYSGGIFGFSILFRIHGSAIYKALTPAVISATIYLLLYLYIPPTTWHYPLFEHPYPMTALVTAFTFLLVFRANYSYNRWWEAYTTVYMMHSKWLDFATEVAAFHYQSFRYRSMKPPSFGAHPEIQSALLRDADIITTTTNTIMNDMDMAEWNEDHVDVNNATAGGKKEDPQNTTTAFTTTTTTTVADREQQQLQQQQQFPPSIDEDHEVHHDHDMDTTHTTTAIAGDDAPPPPPQPIPIMPIPTIPIIQRPTRQRQQHKRQATTVEDLMQQLDAHEKAEKERQEQFDALQQLEEEERMRDGLEEKAKRQLDEKERQMALEEAAAAAAAAETEATGTTTTSTAITSNNNNTPVRPPPLPLHHQQQQPPSISMRNLLSNITNTATSSSPHTTATTTTMTAADTGAATAAATAASATPKASNTNAAAAATTTTPGSSNESPLKGLQRRFKTFRRQRHQQQQQQQQPMATTTNNINKKKKKRNKRSRFASSFWGHGSNNNNNTTTTTENTTNNNANNRHSKSINRPKTLRQLPINNYHHDILFEDRFDISTGKPYSVFTAVTRTRLRAGHVDPDQVPPLLFLEEIAHLLSLLSAVAFSTLRNDLPYADSPLTMFEPGLPWPHVDPDAYKRKNRRGWEGSKYRWYTLMRFVLGASRTARDRTLYNAARPFRVIGNVSDEEILQLQQARGPLAKVALVSMWLQELISREYQTLDSCGHVAPPIISRLYQLVSEGMAGYNQARKIASIPFPFVHAQLTTLFLGVVDFMVIPVLMLSFVNDAWLGFVLNVSTVLCFTGLHEVAREIESPFQNVPNDVPLNNFQAQFNEGLMVMFYGYHPDAYWDVDETRKEVHEVNATMAGNNNNNNNNATDGTGAAMNGGTTGSSTATRHNKRGSNGGAYLEEPPKAVTAKKKKKPAAATALNPTPPIVIVEKEPASMAPAAATAASMPKPSSYAERRGKLSTTTTTTSSKNNSNKVTKIRVEQQQQQGRGEQQQGQNNNEYNDEEDDKFPAIEAFLGSLSQSGSFAGGSASAAGSPLAAVVVDTAPSSNHHHRHSRTTSSSMQRHEAFEVPPLDVDEDREEYDNLGGNTRTLSADQLDLQQAKERQQQLIEAQQQQHQQQLQLQQEEQEEALAKRFSTPAHYRTSSSQQVSFRIPDWGGGGGGFGQGEDSSLIFQAGSSDDGSKLGSVDGSVGVVYSRSSTIRSNDHDNFLANDNGEEDEDDEGHDEEQHIIR